MNTLLVNEHNNLIVGRNFIIKQGDDALIQDIRTRLKMFKGEYPFDTTQGLDIEYLLSENNRITIENGIIEEVKKDDRVSRVNVIDMDFSEGKLGLSLEIITKEGATVNV